MDIKQQIFQAIREKGYVNISDFMEIVLTAKSNSYYKSKNPLDEKDGDFITAPEISQMFGEMIGIWIYKQWELLDKPQKINLVELGPGRGVLLRDILRVLEKTEFPKDIDLYLLDINPVLIEIQKTNLSNYKNIYWIEDIDSLPKSLSIVIANEFFDALPINQFVKEKKNWKEVTITSNPHGTELKFDKISLREELNSHLNFEHKKASDGAILEESIQTSNIISKLSEYSTKFGNINLIIDYGYDIDPKARKSTQYYPTLQAVKNHKFSPILDNIGQADLTSHIDYNNIRKIAEFHGAKCSITITQRELLLKLGIEIRCQNLKEQNPSLSRILTRQYNRLTSNKEMGNLFKAVVISKRNQEIFGF